MSEEQQPETNKPAPAKNLAPRRRGRRGGRGRRHPAPVVPATESLSQTGSPAKQIEPPIRLGEMPVRPEPSRQKFQTPVSVPVETPAGPSRPEPRKISPGISKISQAVEEVAQVVGSLRQALEQMEEVLELVELAERQKTADEREIESLLRALRQFQSRGGRPDRHEPADRHNRPARPNRPDRQERPDRPESPENQEQPPVSND